MDDASYIELEGIARSGICVVQTRDSRNVVFKNVTTMDGSVGNAISTA